METRLYVGISLWGFPYFSGNSRFHQSDLRKCQEFLGSGSGNRKFSFDPRKHFCGSMAVGTVARSWQLFHSRANGTVISRVVSMEK